MIGRREWEELQPSQNNSFWKLQPSIPLFIILFQNCHPCKSETTILLIVFIISSIHVHLCFFLKLIIDVLVLWVRRSYLVKTSCWNILIYLCHPKPEGCYIMVSIVLFEMLKIAPRWALYILHSSMNSA